jgi:hypothetical protein
MRKILCLLFFCIPFVAKPDAPGYQGKHFILSYVPDLTPTNYLQFSGSSFNTIPNEVTGIYLRHNINLEYVVSRTMSIGGEVSFFSQKPLFAPNEGEKYYINIKSTGLAFNLIFYSAENNPVAPVGNYIKLKFFVNNFTANATTGAGLRLPYPLDSGMSKGQSVGFGIGFGHNHFIANRVLITYGASLDVNVDLGATTLSSETEKVAFKHIFGTYILPSLKIGIGGLLF